MKLASFSVYLAPSKSHTRPKKNLLFVAFFVVPGGPWSARRLPFHRAFVRSRAVNSRFLHEWFRCQTRVFFSSHITSPFWRRFWTLAVIYRRLCALLPMECALFRASPKARVTMRPQDGIIIVSAVVWQLGVSLFGGVCRYGRKGGIFALFVCGRRSIMDVGPENRTVNT